MPKTKARKEVPEVAVTLFSSLISIVGGLLVSFLLLFILEWTKEVSDFGLPTSVYGDFIGYSFKDLSAFIKVFYNAAPLILCGLAVGFAFKAGLFNIGIVGQYTIGAFFSLIAVILWGVPWWIATIVAMVTGALWGFVPGFFKAKYNINEVITTIMLNWAAFYFTKLLLYNLPNMRTLPPGNRTDPVGYHNVSGLLPDLGLQELTDSSFINIGILIAIVLAVVIHIILNKTTFGYEIKACGHNRNASKYAGIKEQRTIILTFIISGALAGAAGAVSYLAGTIQFNIETSLLGLGFNGIPVALLAFSSPLGIIASGIFIGYLQVGGQAFEGVYSSEVTDVILSVIIYFSAFTLIVSQYIQKRQLLKNMSGIEPEDGFFTKLLNRIKAIFDKKENIEHTGDSPDQVHDGDEEVSK